MAKGIMPWQIARMTRKQLHLLTNALNDDLMLRYKLAGWEVQEREEITVDNLGALEAAINGAVKR